jgi:8-oxo-dGTP pyrophosphatase MutT (NUDIX family)
MSSGFSDAGVPLLSSRRLPLRAPARFVRLSQLRKLRGSEQVAAVCFRARKGRIEFLLVRTRSDRWTFPKGSAEPGLTHSQAAALEAFEEAGVHGRIEDACFARYVRGKRNRARGSASGVDVVVDAHLCEVTWLEPPQESDRAPTWFSAEKAKRRLREERESNYGAELARIIDLAVIRIQRLARSQRASVTIPKVRCIEEGRDVASRAKDNDWRVLGPGEASAR